MSTEPQTRDLIADANEVVHLALAKAVGDEQGFAQAVSLTVVPGEEQGAFVPVLVVVLTAPSPVLGQRLFVNLLTFDLHLTQEGADHIVGQGVEQMRRQRSEVVSEVARGALDLVHGN